MGSSKFFFLSSDTISDKSPSEAAELRLLSFIDLDTDPVEAVTSSLRSIKSSMLA